MKNRLAVVCMVLGMAALMLGLALSMFEYVATDCARYDEIQFNLDVYPSVGVERAELKEAQKDIAAYLKGDSEGFNREVTMFGERRLLFNQRELAHMEDVRVLFALERDVRAGAWCAAIILLALSMALSRPARRAHWMRRNARATLWALGLWLALGLALGIACGFDFNAAFIRFHELLFTNDLWMLDPATDAMIRMYPEAFFVRMARELLIAMGLGVLIAVVPAMAGFLPERMLTPE